MIPRTVGSRQRTSTLRPHSPHPSGRTIGRATFKPGWKWSECVKPIAKTPSCQTAHFGYVISGRMKVAMDETGVVYHDAEGTVDEGTAGSPPANAPSRSGAPTPRAAQLKAPEAQVWESPQTSTLPGSA